jgi:predicted ferric reductase
MTPSKNTLRGALWIGVYLAITLAPLVIVSIGERPVPRDFWRELGIALGFVGLSMLGLQFVLTARFRGVSAPYGLDIILQFHRLISIVAFGFIFAHIALIVVPNPEMRYLLNPVEAPWRARFAQISTLCLIVIVATSLWRTKARLSYEGWKVLHGLLAVGIIVFGLMHALGVGHYLSMPWKQALWALMALTVLSMFVFIRLVKPLLLRNRPYRVVDVQPKGGETWSLLLEPVGHRGIRNSPGQFAWLKLGDNPFTYEEHPFSFSSSPERGRVLEFTIKELGDFTSRIGEVKLGTTAFVEGPFGIFTPDRAPASHYVFIAGGVGISPILGILRTLADREHRGRHLLFYANKDQDSIADQRELEELRERLDLEIVHVLEEPPEDWQGEQGWITEETLNRHLPEDRKAPHYFLCGPPAMLDAVSAALHKAGAPFEKVHLEYFQLLD